MSGSSGHPSKSTYLICEPPRIRGPVDKLEISPAQCAGFHKNMFFKRYFWGKLQFTPSLSGRSQPFIFSNSFEIFNFEALAHNISRGPGRIENKSLK